MESYAIVGASNNKEKYGYKVTLSLKELGYTIFPVNPKEDKILSLKSYPNLESVIDDGEQIDIVIFVVPPIIAEKILESVVELGIESVWFQPGSESKKAIDFCKMNDIFEVHNSCIMVAKGNVK